MCVCVRKEKEAEEKDGKGDKVETAASDGKSAVVEEAATGDNATEIADKSQVVFFSYAALRCSPPLSDNATLRQCNSQAVQLRCSPPLSERCCFVVMHAPLRCLPPLSM